MFRKFTFRRYLLLHQPIYIYSGAAPGFWLGEGNIKQNFIQEFFSSPVLQWRRQNFGSGDDIQQKCTNQRVLENFEKFIKQFAQNLKQFSKIFQK